MAAKSLGFGFLLSTLLILPEGLRAQEGESEQQGQEVQSTTTTTEGEAEVPAVEIIQEEPQAEPALEVQEQEATRAPRPAPAAAPAPIPAVAVPAEPAPLEPELVIPNQIVQPLPPYYGPPGGAGNYERTMESSQSPIVPIDGIVPGNLMDFSSAASRITRESINEQDPLSTHDVLSKVPGVAIINDDGLGRHGGISIRGTPARRSRKVGVLEDGRFINQSIWLDPSTHYIPPPERIESIEVLRGTNIVYGPNNNSGMVNFRNLQPFGPSETVVSGEGGTVSLSGADPDSSSAAKWHVHTRHSTDNWGIVVSYTGANAAGAWDSERLRYNDFYGAIGWKGEKSDFTFSTVYFAQRDNYDESNLEGDDDDAPGEIERQFFNDIQHCKTCFNPASVLNEYNADILLMQGVYNYYVNQDTTVSARVYGQLMERSRFFNIEEGDPRSADGNLAPIVAEEDGELVALVGEGSMQGNPRSFDHIGTEVRTEFANRPFMFGLNQDLQVGVRYEHHEFNDRSFVGRQGQVLDGFDSRGFDVWNRELTADAFSAFVQTDIAVNDRLNLVPGARLEHYRLTRLTNVLTTDDEEGEGAECAPLGEDECIIYEGYTNDPYKEGFTRTHVLPGMAFSYGFGGKDLPADYGSKSLSNQALEPTHTTTLYGGYHRGLTMHVLREVTFPTGDELGDNYQLGVRSVAVKGLTFDVAGFHQRIKDYQFASEVDIAGDRTFDSVDEVEVNGFEIYSRLDSRPFTGWKLNPYTEASFTYADTTVANGTSINGDDEIVSVAGNEIPEFPREFAYLTAGIESTAGWNASVSWTYRGSFYTDIFNTPYGGDPEGEAGLVPSVWLLSARANYTIPETNMVLYVSGENLTDELYITDRADGIKAGIGRTVMGGARFQW